MVQTQLRFEALTRAQQGESDANIPAILSGFIARGIPEDQIKPRENVFTFNAWLALGRSVKKGEHGVKVHTWIEKTKENGEKTRLPRSTVVFHVSQTEESTGKPREPRGASSAAPRPAVQPDKLPARFRTLADGLQSKIDHCFRPMTQNPTPKRNREYQSRLWEGRNTQRTQKALRAIADAIDGHTLPVELDTLTTRDEVAKLVHKGLSNNGGYYSVIESADFQDTTPAGRILQGMIAGNSQAQAEETRKLKIQELEAAVKLSTIPGYFPTPPELVQMMCEIAELESGMSVLEPSAGNGNIADLIRDSMPDCDLDVCEINPSLAQILKLKGHNVVFQYPDFLEMPTAKTFNYDRILMNPPFENQADIDHIRHAYSHLADNGVLVAILSPSFEYRNDRKATEFRQWLEDVGASWDEIPAGAFKQSGTMVASRIMVIDKRQN